MPEVMQVLVWPSEEHYPRFREVCEDRMPETYAEWLTFVEGNLARCGIDASGFEKIDVDPDIMAEWCRANGGKVDSNARAKYVAFVAMVRDEKGANPLN